MFFLGLLAGGPLAMWTSYLVTLAGMWITAAVLAEICSALPLSGSIYTWAAESAGAGATSGKRVGFARLVGFTVAWWACTAWMTFAAGNCQACTFSCVWLHVLTYLYRPRPTTFYLSWSSMNTISPVGLQWTMSNSARLYG